MKLKPVNNIEKRNTVTSKKIYNDVMSVNFDIIVFSPVSPEQAGI